MEFIRPNILKSLLPVGNRDFFCLNALEAVFQKFAKTNMDNALPVASLVIGSILISCCLNANMQFYFLQETKLAIIVFLQLKKSLVLKRLIIYMNLTSLIIIKH